VAPPREELQATLRALQEARGEQPGASLANDRHHGLRSARDTLRSFFEGMWDLDWGGDGALALRTMDLSEIPPRIRDLDAPLLADYLRQVLERVSFVVWQETPDDPASQEPYLHFQHPAGSIVIAPVREADGTTAWRFSAETMANMRDLYTAIEDVPLVAGAAIGAERPLFFRLRDRMRDLSPSLLQRGLLLENWQWLGLLAVLIAGLLFGALLHLLVVRGLRRVLPDADDELDRQLGRRLLWPGRVLMTMVVVFFGINRLGLPDDVYRPLQTANFLLMAVGTAWLVYNIIGLVTDRLHRRAQRTTTYVDEILTSLVGGVLRAAVVIVALFVVADMLSIPYQGVLAGLGFGGLALAFAAQNTIANLFGAAVLLGDRPFRRGDTITVATVTGTVEHVGIRSTRIRTGADSVVVIPNATLASSTIDNQGQRRVRRLKIDLRLAGNTPPAAVEALAAELPAVIDPLPSVVPGSTTVHASELAAGSIDLRVECTLDPAASEGETRHRLILELCRAVEARGLGLAGRPTAA
jgi:small-conductance mechanosensitive channel